MPTDCIYLRDSNVNTNPTTLNSLIPRAEASPSLINLFKLPPPDGASHSSGNEAFLTTASTIFHPQGGGQPSDTGSIALKSSSSSSFSVTTVRKGTEAPHQGEVLHYGTLSPETLSSLTPGAEVIQHIDAEKRLLHSRIHDAGHLLSLAVRSLASAISPSSISKGGVEISDLETKAQHYPSSAFVEFKGLIDGSWKDRIQTACNELVNRDLEIKVHWCGNWEEVEKLGVITTRETAEAFWSKGEKMRVVEVEGLGVHERSYACGGTHVPRTGEVGAIVVRKVSRQKGISKVSYEVA